MKGIGVRAQLRNLSENGWKKFVSARTEIIMMQQEIREVCKFIEHMNDISEDAFSVEGGDVSNAYKSYECYVDKYGNPLKSTLFEDEIHRVCGLKGLVSLRYETRKQLKELLYDSRLVFPDSRKLIKSMDKLQDLMGKWHDNEVTSGLLARVSQSKNISKADVAGINRVLKAISSENGKIFVQIDSSRKVLRRFDSIRRVPTCWEFVSSELPVKIQYARRF